MAKADKTTEATEAEVKTENTETENAETQAEGTEAKAAEVEPIVEFGVYEPKVKPNIYAGHIEKLLTMPENTSVTITVPDSELLKHKRYFQRAANDVDRTAKTVDERKTTAETTSVTYVLGPRQDRSKRAPRSKSVAEAQSAENTQPEEEGAENTQPEGEQQGSESATVEGEAPTQ